MPSEGTEWSSFEALSQTALRGVGCGAKPFQGEADEGAGDAQTRQGDS